jgi:TPR repeat protein
VITAPVTTPQAAPRLTPMAERPVVVLPASPALSPLPQAQAPVQIQVPAQVPALAQPAATSASAARPRLADEEVTLLLERAQRLIREQRDVTAARQFLIRAEQGGSARAAYQLAETFDPAMLDSWNIRGVKPDVPRARILYGRALDGGVAEARARLDRLPN